MHLSFIELDLVFFGSVLEQFSITKFSLFEIMIDYLPLIVLKNLNFIISILSSLKIFLFKIPNNLGFFKTFFVFIKYILIYVYKFIASLFRPTTFSTKNYVFGRFAQVLIKTFVKIHIRKRLLIFWRTNTQIVKLKTQLGIQEGIKSNFGNTYPFTQRFYQYYPFMLSIFLLIAVGNLNGLLCYGFTNTAFLLQNFVYSFEIVVGLTILV